MTLRILLVFSLVILYVQDTESCHRRATTTTRRRNNHGSTPKPGHLSTKRRTRRPRTTTPGTSDGSAEAGGPGGAGAGWSSSSNESAEIGPGGSGSGEQGGTNSSGSGGPGGSGGSGGPGGAGGASGAGGAGGPGGPGGAGGTGGGGDTDTSGDTDGGGPDGGGNDWGPSYQSTEANIPHHHDDDDPADRHIAFGPGGWTPSPDVQKQWKKWLDKYKKQHGSSGKGHAEGAVSDGDLPPPPWSYVPRDIGLPDFCYDPPVKGNCKDKINRWAYNPYQNECVMFIYSGCGENQNNFIKKLKCEQTCMKPPVFGCETETLYDDYFFTRKCN